MSVLEDLAEQVQVTKDKETSGSGGWIGALIAGLFVVIITGIMAFSAWKNGKELAKLKHEKAVAEEAKHQADVDVRIAVHEAVRDEALAKAAEAKKNLEEIQATHNKVEETYHEARKRIDEITSWDDVDTFLGGGS